MEKIIRSNFSAINFENTLIEKSNQERQSLLQPITHPNIIVVCPYMTEFAKKYLEDKFKEKITLITTQEIKTVKNIVSPQELQILQKMNLWIDLGDQKEISGPDLDIDNYRKNFANRGTVYFDHKVPDYFSFPDVLAKGEIRDKNGRKIGQLAELIPETIPPYKIEFKEFSNRITSTTNSTISTPSTSPVQKPQVPSKNRLALLKKTPTPKDNKYI